MINEAIKLEYGATYVVEVVQFLSEAVKNKLLMNLKDATKHLGCNFLILDGGMKLGKVKEEEGINNS